MVYNNDTNQEGIILRTHPHGDNNLVLKILTADNGKISLYARNARNSKKRFSGNPEVFDHGLFNYTSKRSSLPSLENFNHRHVFRNIRSDLYKLTAGSLICEAFDAIIKDQQDDTEHARQVFDALFLGLQAMDEAKDVHETFRACFLSLSGLLAVSGLLDVNSVPPASRNNLIQLIDKVELACERKLLSRTSFDLLLAELKAA